MTDHIGKATTMIDLDALEKLADEATPGDWEAVAIPGRYAKEVTGSTWVIRGSLCSLAVLEDSRVAEYGVPIEKATLNAAFIAAANPATIKALIALVKDAWAERDQLEQNIIDASNGRFPPQGQADPDDEIDGLAHMVYGLRRERAFLARNGKGEG